MSDSDYKLWIDSRNMLVKKLEQLQFPDTFLKRCLLTTGEEKKSEADIEAQYPKMLEELKWHLIKEKIAKEKEIKVEDADLTAYAKKAAQAQFTQYGMMNIPDDILENYAKDMLKKKENVQSMVDRVMDEKIVAVIKSSVKLTNKKVSLDNFNKLFEEK